jgi:hypothetical protein
VLQMPTMVQRNVLPLTVQPAVVLVHWFSDRLFWSVVGATGGANLGRNPTAHYRQACSDCMPLVYVYCAGVGSGWALATMIRVVVGYMPCHVYS